VLHDTASFCKESVTWCSPAHMSWGRNRKVPPPLENYPACDDEVRAALADEAVGNGQRPARKEEQLARGASTRDKPWEKFFLRMGSLPDVRMGRMRELAKRSFLDPPPHPAVRTSVSSQIPANGAVAADAIFRYSGKLPELWHPDTGKMEPVATWQKTADGRTMVPLRLDQAGSVFVVFRKPSEGADPIVKILRDGEPLDNSATPGKLVIKKATYWHPGRPVPHAGRHPAARSPGQGRQVDEPGLVRFWKRRSGSENPKDPASRIFHQRPGCGRQRKRHQNPSLPPRMPLAEPKAEMKGTDLLAWEPGKYEFTTASGKKSTYEAAKVPGTMEIKGRWTLQFPPKTGSPRRDHFG